MNGGDNPYFDRSYQRIFGEQVGLDSSADHFFEAFYERFLQSEGIASLFSNTDMANQITMLRKSLFHLLTFYLTNRPSKELKQLAMLHREIGVEVEMYDKWLHALLATVAGEDKQADEKTLLAWSLALSPGLTFMRLAASFP